MMKTISKFMLGAMALGLFACSSDEPVADVTTPASSEGDVYAAITLNLTTRSETVTPEDSEHGTEVGTVAENNVDRILVVLATQNGANYDYVTAAYAESQRNNIATDPTYVVRFESKALAAKENQDVYVFAYCNPKENVVNTFFTEADGKLTPKESVASFQDAVLKNAEGNIWGDNQFLMTNYDLASKTIPSLNTLTTVYNKKENPFDLGVITVQRVAARFDIGLKPASEGLDANTYAIIDPINGQNAANVTLDAVALFNEANDFYAFRHSSADGSSANWNLCGKDIPSSYIVSPYWESMRGGMGPWIADAYKDALYQSANSIKAPKSYVFKTFASLAGTDNRDDLVNEFNARYIPWRYTTPNTIPAADDANDIINRGQRKGFTTGVIYRGYITATGANAKLAAAMAAENIIYAYDGVLYGDLQMLSDYVKTHPESGVARGYAAAFGDAETPSDLTSTQGGFTIYKPEGEPGSKKYYVYYYYYNQHNNRPDDNLYPMEFGVVRNNVYKLTVKEILEFGHPGDPGDDPDPEDPDDPDEDEKAFFKVSVKVLPWVVRINDIEL